MADDQHNITIRKFDMSSIKRDSTVLAIGRRHSGKCLAKGTPVLLFNGRTKLVEDIDESDILIGDDGGPRKVLSLVDGIGQLYTLMDDFNNVYTVNEHHILSLFLSRNAYTVHTTVYWFVKDTRDCSIKLLSEKFKTATEATEYMCKKSLTSNCGKYVDVNIKSYLALPDHAQRYIWSYQVGALKFAGVTDYTPQMAYRFAFDIFTTASCMAWLWNLFKPTKIPDGIKYGTIQVRNAFCLGMYRALGLNCGGDIPVRGCLTQDVISICRSVGLVCLPRAPGVIHVSEVGNNIIKMKFRVVNTFTGEYYGFAVDCNSRFVLGNYVVTHNSWVIRDIMYYTRDIPMGVVFSASESANPFFGDFFPDTFVHNTFKPDVLNGIIKQQKELMHRAKETGLSEDGKHPSNNTIVVMDDVAHLSKQWTKDQCIKDVFFNGRHYNIFLVFAMQYAREVPPNIRTNIDYVFMFNDFCRKNRQKLYEDYCGFCQDFKSFDSIYSQIAKDHTCLVVTTNGVSPKIEDNLFWYRAKPREPFKVGSKQLWKYHDMWYNKRHDEEDSPADDVDRFQKGKRIKVIINN